MSFAHPLLLLLLAPSGVAALLWLRRMEQTRRRTLALFGDAEVLARVSSLPGPGDGRRRSLIRLAGLGLLAVALARPRWGENPALLDQAGRDVLVLLDLSRSMLVSDVGSTRLAAAKTAIREVIAASPGSRIGLCIFGGGAFLQLPLTSDRSAFLRYLDQATPDDLGDPSTDIGEALRLAARTFEHAGERGYRTVLLASDGETEGEVGPGADRLSQAGIPVLAVGVGTPAGGPVPADSAEAPEQWHRDHIGRIAISRLDQESLRQVAALTNGSYVRWSRAEGAGAAGRALASLRARQMPGAHATEQAERFQWPLLLGLLLLLAEAALLPAHSPLVRPSDALLPAPATTRVAVLVGLLAALLPSSGCDRAKHQAARGAELYQAGKFPEAYGAFRASLAARPDPATGLMAGNTLYRLHRYEDAARQYKEESGGPAVLRERSAYNLGDAYIRAAEDAPENTEQLWNAVAAFEEALRLDPGDRDAKWNLELALRRLGDDRMSGGSPGRTRRGDYGRGNQNTPGYQGSPEQRVGAMAGGGMGSGEGESAEELSETQARALLETVEKEELQSHQGRPVMRGRSEGRDW